MLDRHLHAEVEFFDLILSGNIQPDAAFFAFAQRISKSSGVRNTPPPVPVRVITPAPVLVTTAPVSGGATDWLSVSAGSRNSCARTRFGRLFCWGYGLYGQLGYGGNVSDDDPSEVFAP